MVISSILSVHLEVFIGEELKTVYKTETTFLPKIKVNLLLIYHWLNFNFALINLILIHKFMNTETSRIRLLLKNSWDGNMWHGANLKNILEGIDAEKALRKPAAGAHNIYELVLHMHCWRNFVVRHLNGDADFKVSINSEIDWPVNYEQTDEGWMRALAQLEKSQAEVVEAFSKFEDAQLDEPMHGRKFSWYDFIHGMIHHDIYHSAQIAILKK
jgi:uncharacterized damage-inducible protein DinB